MTKKVGRISFSKVATNGWRLDAVGDLKHEFLIKQQKKI
jgi:hypothetical protein